MSNIIKSSLPIAFVLLLISLGSCQDKCTETRTYLKYTPVKKALTEVRESFKAMPTQELQNPGKIYTFGSRLYIVDRGIGFHVVDNSNPSAPIFTEFIQLDGCLDVAMKGNTLYANQGPDIVAIAMDGEPRIIGRGEDILSDQNNSDSVILRWESREVTEVVETDCDNQGNWRGNPRSFANDDFSGGVSFESSSTSSSVSDNNRVNSSGSSGSGVSGSMARFSIVAGQLYVVSDWSMTTFDLDNDFRQISQFNIGNGVETIFGTQDYLYLGTNVGMLIYDRNNGNTPTYVSQLSHARGCDPVVVQGDIAFVTLRGNSRCGQAESGLYVVNLAEIRNPSLLSMHPMADPYGLGVRDDILMICDGNAGLRVFDKSNLDFIGDSEISSDASVKAYDVILQDDIAILSAEEGVYQYEYDNAGKLNKLSTLIAK